MGKKGLSVVIPCFNEGQGISQTITELHTTLAGVKTFSGYEIIVVDDGSTDNTAEVLRGCPAIEILTHDTNSGYGASLKTGISKAQYDTVCIIDADGTYPIKAIPELLNKFYNNNFDMVVGARTGASVAIPSIRKPAKWCLKQLARFITGKDIPDLNSGLRIFKRSVVLKFFPVLPDGFSFTTTITIGMLESKYKVSYVPIDYFRRIGSSKIRPIYDTLNFTMLVLRMALYFAPAKIFLPVSVFFVFLAIAWGVFSFTVLGRFADVSTIVIAMSGIQIGMMGLIAHLINRRLPNTYRKETLPVGSSQDNDLVYEQEVKDPKPANQLFN